MKAKMLNIEFEIDDDLYNALKTKGLQGEQRVLLVKKVVEEKKIDLSKPISDKGFNTLHLTIINDWCDPEMVKYLHSKGVNVNESFECWAPRRNIFTALTMYGIGYNDFNKSVIEALLECNATVSPPSDIWTSIFDILSKFCPEDVDLYKVCRAKLPHENQENLDKNTWWEAIEKEDLPAIKNLVEELGFDVDKTDDDYDCTALLKICPKPSEKAQQIFKYLLDHGANPNFERNEMQENYSTPLLTVIVNGQKNNFDMLIAQEKIDLNQQSPLCIAARYGRKDMVEALLEKGASKDQTYEGNNALVCALTSDKITNPTEKLEMITYLTQYMQANSKPTSKGLKLY